MFDRNTKCRSSYGTYVPRVVCSDGQVRQGFKNKTFRVNGPKHFYGPFTCECGYQKCIDPWTKLNDGGCNQEKN